MDEPTSGTSADVEILLRVLKRLVARGDTVVVIEHQLDVVAAADWVIDLGPGAGNEGGTVVAEGSPEQVAANPDSNEVGILPQFLNEISYSEFTQATAHRAAIDAYPSWVHGRYKDCFFADIDYDEIGYEIYELMR